MACHPASPESLGELRELRDRAYERGDECLGTLLAGVDLYVSLGRELELLDLMRHAAQDLRNAVDNTPTAEDLRRLYEAGEQEHPKD